MKLINFNKFVFKVYLRFLYKRLCKDFFFYKYINYEEIEVSFGIIFGYIVIEGSVLFRFFKIKEIFV